MAEYIEKKDLLKVLPPKCNMGDMYATAYNTCLNTIENLIKESPTADVVPVIKGHWEERRFIVFDSEIKLGYNCSECNTTWDTETNFCPYCGADMRKEGADNGK